MQPGTRNRQPVRRLTCPAAKSAHWKRIYPEWEKFRDEEFLWFRVADNTYDNYVFNSKVGSESAKKM
jgi:TRAP-type mannitol/chloroaromatic compound transport system substrate-binding protein